VNYACRVALRERIAKLETEILKVTAKQQTYMDEVVTLESSLSDTTPPDEIALKEELIAQLQRQVEQLSATLQHKQESLSRYHNPTMADDNEDKNLHSKD